MFISFAIIALVIACIFLLIWTTRAADEQLRTVLVAGEEIRIYAVQRRIHALLHRRSAAASTTGRFIFLKRKAFGGFDMFDIRWQDIKSAKISVGMISSSLRLTYNSNLSDTAMDEGNAKLFIIRGLHTGAAQALYRDCQIEDQAWRERRRVRSIEEMRAKAGGVQIATGIHPASVPQFSDRPLELAGRSTSHGHDTIEEKLIKAKALLGEGLITDSAYDAMKARIIGSI